jgi:hypothetical protein
MAIPVGAALGAAVGSAAGPGIAAETAGTGASLGAAGAASGLGDSFKTGLESASKGINTFVDWQRRENQIDVTNDVADAIGSGQSWREFSGGRSMQDYVNEERLLSPVESLVDIGKDVMTP